MINIMLLFSFMIFCSLEGFFLKVSQKIFSIFIKSFSYDSFGLNTLLAVKTASLWISIKTIWKGVSTNTEFCYWKTIVIFCFRNHNINAISNEFFKVNKYIPYGIYIKLMEFILIWPTIILNGLSFCKSWKILKGFDLIFFFFKVEFQNHV